MIATVRRRVRRQDWFGAGVDLVVVVIGHRECIGPAGRPADRTRARAIAAAFSRRDDRPADRRAPRRQAQPGGPAMSQITTPRRHASPARPPRLARPVGLLALLLLAAAPASARQASADAAERLIEDGRHAEALSMLLDLARRQPRDARIAALTGRTHFHLRDADRAVSQLERAVRLEPGKGAYHFWLGEAYGLQLATANRLRQLSIAERMRRSYERAIEAEPEAQGAYLRLIQFHSQAPPGAGGDLQRAREYAVRLSQFDRFAGTLLQTHIEELAGDTAAADRLLSGLIAAFPDSSRPREALIMRHMDRGRADAAWALLRPVAEADAPSAITLFLVGRWSAVTGRELDRGERALREYLRRSPGPEDPTYAAAHTRIGQILLHRGDRDGARREYESALRLDPTFQPAIDALRALR
jgi:tetratricopeptide (TPR) repeat protein